MTRLLLIEDDPFLIEWIGRLMVRHFPSVELVIMHSEHEVLIRKNKIISLQVRAIILDCMLPWEDGRFDHLDARRGPRGLPSTPAQESSPTSAIHLNWPGCQPSSGVCVTRES
jgi:hypothetical protein